MKKTRRIIVYIAISADGYIARPDGDVEWLNRPRPKGNYGIGAFFRSVDTILWGRKTYEEAQTRGGVGLFGLKVKNYVFSRRPLDHPSPDAELVREPVAAFARRLRSRPGKDIWMMGGAGLIASFLDEGQIDEFRIHVIPVFIGEGIALIAPRHRQVPLKLLWLRRFPDGVVRLDYEVIGRSGPGKRDGRGRHR